MACWVLACPATAWGQGGEYTRYYFDQPIPLGIDPGRIVVHQDLEGQPPPPPLHEILPAYGIDPQTIDPKPLAGWFVVDTPGDVQDGEDVEMLVAQMATDPGLSFVAPLFIDEYGDLFLTNEVLVRFKQGVDDDQQIDILLQSGVGEILEQDWLGMENAYRIKSASKNGFVAMGKANALAQSPTTRWSELGLFGTGRHHDLPDDPTFDEAWHHLNYGQTGGTQDKDMDTAEAWTLETGSADVVVAILDDGSQVAHPDLNMSPGFDVAAYYPLFGGSGIPINMCDNHGTAVAGVIAAITDNSLGVAGVAPGATVLPIRVGVSDIPCDGGFSYYSSGIALALSLTTSFGVDITNSSFGFDSPSASVADMYALTSDLGVIHFASTGNDGATSIGFPASVPEVWAIGSVNATGTLAGTSNTGDVDFVAPGVGIWTTDRTGSDGYEDPEGYTLFGGTSAASPNAAGVAALVLSADPSLTQQEVYEIMQATAADAGDPGHDDQYGWGIVNAHGSVRKALGYEDDPTPIVVNEIRTADPGLPDTEEYLELLNPENTGSAPLDDLAYVVVGDESADFDNFGIVEAHHQFPAQDLGAGATYVVAEDTFTLGNTDEIADLNFENNDSVTHLLIRGFTGAVGCDLDLNDDGTLDYEPWYALEDAVALLESGVGDDLTYTTTTVGPNTIGDVPRHVYRCNGPGAWQIGPADPSVGVDTPRFANPVCDGDMVAFAGTLAEVFGNASGLIDPFGLIISSAYADGDDGANIVLGPSEGGAAGIAILSIPPYAMGVGAVEIEAVGVVDGQDATPLAALTTIMMDGPTQLTTGWALAGDPDRQVRLVLGGEVVAETVLAGATGSVATGEVVPDRIGAGEGETGPLTLGASLAQAGLVEIPGGPAATADAIEVTFLTEAPIEAISALSVSLDGVESLLLSDPALVMFEHPHRIVGEAIMEGQGDSVLITPVLQDEPWGVAIDVGQAGSMTAATGAPALEPGAILQYAARGQIGDGQTPLLALTQVGADEGSVLTAVSPADQQALIVARAYLGDEMVAQTPPMEQGPVGAIADAGAAGAGSFGATSDSIEGEVDLAQPAQVTLAGQAQVLADRVGVALLEPAFDVGESPFTRLVVKAQGPESFVIHDEVSGDGGGSCEADVNGDGALNILDFVAFQNLFSAGDDKADCNDDGLLNILDFVCYQNLFSAGCP